MGHEPVFPEPVWEDATDDIDEDELPATELALWDPHFAMDDADFVAPPPNPDSNDGCAITEDATGSIISMSCPVDPDPTATNAAPSSGQSAQPSPTPTSALMVTAMFSAAALSTTLPGMALPCK